MLRSGLLLTASISVAATRAFRQVGQESKDSFRLAISAATSVPKRNSFRSFYPFKGRMRFLLTCVNAIVTKESFLLPVPGSQCCLLVRIAYTIAMWKELFMCEDIPNLLYAVLL